MKVWAVVVDKQVDSLWEKASSALKRLKHLEEIKGSQLACYLKEFTIHEEEVV